jgi:murein L,D-transpeptidase YafK
MRLFSRSWRCSLWALLLLALTGMTASAQKTVEDRILQFSNAVAHRLTGDFKKAGVSYPPRALTFIGFKQEKLLEVYAADGDGKFRFIRSYPILAASGGLGPKLREGDRQVPEGLYRVESLNPNSRFHLSLRIDYPNAADRERAKVEKRTNLGGDIMIHGDAVSIGCLAMGDPASEDLFVLAALTGVRNANVILSPIDLRSRDLTEIPTGAPKWTAELYDSVKAALRPYDAPPRVK